MSKIKIVGHASGSGVLTIAAPNTNTDRTITIPDVTGTLLDSGSDLPAANLTGTIVSARLPAANQTAKLPLAGGTMTGTIAGFTSTGIDDNADATAITIDSSENIGMGITTPVGDGARTLHLSNDTGIGFGNGAWGRPDFQIKSIDGSRLGFICGNGGATEDVVFNTDGEIGIGTTSPSEKLHVVGNIIVTGTITAGDKTTSSSDPTITSNPSAVGHLWINSTSGESYVCTDATNNNNIWVNIGDGTGGFDPWSTTGGTKTTYGAYTVHTFESSGNLVINGSARTFDYLVIAGGGGGGANRTYDQGAGGGGAGGWREGSASLGTGTYAVVVGAGASGSASSSAAGGKGSNSSFNSLLSTGGGGGGSRLYDNENGQDGGSGGGPCGPGGNAGSDSPTTSPRQGKTSGGAGSHSGGGGGGIGDGGDSGSGDQGGAGGPGANNNLRTGSNEAYCAGGGGGNGQTNGNLGGAGGIPGEGGAGARYHINGGPAGRYGSGGGGGGANSSSTGGNGSAGRVVIRYTT